MTEEKKMMEDEKEFTVVDKDNDGFEIDAYPTKEAAQARIALLASEGARPDRYEVKEGAKGEHAKKALTQSNAPKDEKAKAEKLPKGFGK